MELYYILFSYIVLPTLRVVLIWFGHKKTVDVSRANMSHKAK